MQSEVRPASCIQIFVLVISPISPYQTSLRKRPTLPTMTVMTIFNDFEFDVPQQSTNNCQKLRERTRFASRHAVTFWHSGRQK